MYSTKYGGIMVDRYRKLVSHTTEKPITMDHLKIFGDKLPFKGHIYKIGLHGTGNIGLFK
jgi:hypothetical protein